MNKDLITALVDNEIIDDSTKNDVQALIDADHSLAVDYKIQILVKNLLREKVKLHHTPDVIRQRILSDTKKFFNSSGVKYSILIPTFPKLNLLGAVVSEDRDEKFTHILAKAKNNVFAIVTNMNLKELEKNFCKLN